MKRISAIGVAVLTALALSAAIGSASASATVLCSKAEFPCAAGNVQPVGSGIAFGGGSEALKLQGEGLTDLRCSGFHFASIPTATSETILPAKGSAYFWNCWLGTNQANSCLVGANKTDNLVAYWPSGGAGTGAVFVGRPEQELVIMFICQLNGGGSLECAYRANDSVPFSLSASTGLVWTWKLAPKFKLTAGHEECGPTAKFTVDGSYFEPNYISY